MKGVKKAMKKVFALFLAAAMLICGMNIVYAEDSANENTYVDVTGYTYVVDNMRFWSGKTEVENPEGSCEVEVDIIKRKQSNDRDKLIIAAYSDTDKLIGMYTVVHDVQFGKTSSVKVSVTVPENTVLGDIRAFVWDGFDGMNACSNVISRYNNGKIDPKLEYEKELQTSFADVPKDSECAEDIEFSALLGILSGDNDGYFNPTGSVTRADAAAAISHMLGKDEEAYYLRGESIYSDTAVGKIETGYLNLGYIEPVSGDKIAPYADITVGAFIKAAVNALGYKETAQVLGGWPAGYISTARTNGLLTGVNLNINETLTKQELAVLCVNTLDAPIMKNVGYDYTASGAVVPKKVRMDGTNDNKYVTLLNEVFDMYRLEGYVIETSRAGALNANEVKFGIAKSERYDNVDFGTDSFSYTGDIYSMDEITPDRIVTLDIGETDADNYEGLCAEALIKNEKHEKYTIIRFFPFEDNNDDNDDGNYVTATLDLIDVDEYEDIPFADRTDDYIYIYEDDSAKLPTKYNLMTDDSGKINVSVYVNGTLMEGDSRQLIDEYAIGAKNGIIRLVDTSKDGLYDTINIELYMTAQVDAVNLTSKKIIFKSSTNGVTAVTESEDVVCNIYLDGNKISMAELCKDDILSISYEYGNGTKTDFNNSGYYDIYVSRNVQTGVVMAKNDSKETVKIGEKNYRFVGYYDSAMLIGDSYKIYVDYLGKIYIAELIAPPDNYAVVDKLVYSTIDENYQFVMYTAEGEAKTVTFDGDKAVVRIPNVSQSELDTRNQKQSEILKRVYVNGGSASDGKTEISKRVIKYKISQSTGYIREVEFVEPSAGYGVDAEEYIESIGRIGSVRLNDMTKIIDAIKYTGNCYDTLSDLRTTTKASLVNGLKYKAYAFGDRYDGYYPFVIIVQGPGAYNAKSRFAVVSNSVYSGIDEERNNAVYIPVLNAEDTAEIELICSEMSVDYSEAMNLNIGDVIVYETDHDKYIYEFSKIFTAEISGIDSYENLVANAIVENNDKASFETGMVELPDIDNRTYNWVEEWFGYPSDIREPIQLIYGPIVDTFDNKTFSVGKIAQGDFGYEYSGLYTDRTLNEKSDGGVYEIDITDDTAIYEYDYALPKRNRLSKGSISSIRASLFAESNLLDGTDIIPWELEDSGYRPNLEMVNFAFAKVVDGVATDVLVFNAP